MIKHLFYAVGCTVARAVLKTLSIDGCTALSLELWRALPFYKFFIRKKINEELNNHTEDAINEMQPETLPDVITKSPLNRSYLIATIGAGLVGYTIREVGNEIVHHYSNNYNNCVLTVTGLIGGGLKYLLNYQGSQPSDQDFYKQVRPHMLAGAINSVIYQLTPGMTPCQGIFWMMGVEGLDAVIHYERGDSMINKLISGVACGVIGGISCYALYVPLIEQCGLQPTLFHETINGTQGGNFTVPVA